MIDKLSSAVMCRCPTRHVSPIVVQFRASVFHVAASALYRLDGRERIGAAAGCFLCGGFLLSKRDLRVLDLGAY
jgi:hypothetical protein